MERMTTGKFRHIRSSSRSGGRHHLDRRRRQAPPARNGARSPRHCATISNSVKDDRAASYQRTSPSLHRVRGRLVAERTALINQLRALMLERASLCAGATQARAVFAGDIGGRAQRSWTGGFGGSLRTREWRSIHQRIKGYNDELAERVHNEEGCQTIDEDPWDRRADGDRPCGRGWEMPNGSAVAVTWQFGWDWCRVRRRQVENRGCCASASAARLSADAAIHGARNGSPGSCKKIRRSAGGLSSACASTSQRRDRKPDKQAGADCFGRSLHVIAGMWLFKLQPVE